MNFVNLVRTSISLNICLRLLMKLDPDRVKLNLIKDGPFRGCSRMGEGTRSRRHGPPALPKILSHTYYNNETWHSCILHKKHRKYIQITRHTPTVLLTSALFHQKLGFTFQDKNSRLIQGFCQHFTQNSRFLYFFKVL